MIQELIFIGPPACGKGTQTQKISKTLGLERIDTGALLREEIKNKTPDGIIAKQFIDNGNLVPYKIVAQIINNTLMNEKKFQNGCILDGFPRSIPQAETLDEINYSVYGNAENFKIKAIYFDIDEETLIERITNRRSCPKCGSIYNMKFNAPKNGTICDFDGQQLIQRDDDTEEIARKRFDTYFRETEALIDFFEKRNELFKVNANGTMDEVFARIMKIIEE